MPAMRTPHPLTADGAFFVAPRGDHLADSDAGLRSGCSAKWPFFKHIVIVHCTNGKRCFTILSARRTSGIPDLGGRCNGRLDSPSWLWAR